MVGRSDELRGKKKPSRPRSRQLLPPFWSSEFFLLLPLEYLPHRYSHRQQHPKEEGTKGRARKFSNQLRHAPARRPSPPPPTHTPQRVARHAQHFLIFFPPC